MPQLVTGSFSLFLAAPAGCLRGRRARMRGGGNGGACAAKGGPALRPPSGSAARVARAPGWSPRAASSRPCTAHGRSQGRGSRDASARRRDRGRARMRAAPGSAAGGRRPHCGGCARRQAPGGIGPRPAAAGSGHGFFARPGGPAAHGRARGGARAAMSSAQRQRPRIGNWPGRLQQNPRGRCRPGGECSGAPSNMRQEEGQGMACRAGSRRAARLCPPRSSGALCGPPRYPYGRRPHGPLPAGSGADCERVGYRTWQGACQPPRTGRSCDPQRAKPSGAGANLRLQGAAPRGFPKVQEVRRPPEFPLYFAQ